MMTAIERKREAAAGLNLARALQEEEWAAAAAEEGERRRLRASERWKCRCRARKAIARLAAKMTATLRRRKTICIRCASAAGELQRHAWPWSSQTRRTSASVVWCSPVSTSLETDEGFAALRAFRGSSDDRTSLIRVCSFSQQPLELPRLHLNEHPLQRRRFRPLVPWEQEQGGAQTQARAAATAGWVLLHGLYLSTGRGNRCPLRPQTPLPRPHQRPSAHCRLPASARAALARLFANARACPRAPSGRMPSSSFCIFAVRLLVCGAFADAMLPGGAPWKRPCVGPGHPTGK